MEPTIRCEKPVVGCSETTSDRVLVLRYLFARPQRGDIVAFEAGLRARRLCGVGGTSLKRVVGLPGEVVSQRDGIVFVDGRRLDEGYVAPANRDRRSGRWAKVARDSYFVLGDNRRLSCDSRVFGPVRRDDVRGRVVATYWPPGRISLG